MHKEMEIWKDIDGFEWFYQVSNIGRIKSLGRTIHRKKMGVIVLPERILNPHVDVVGYPRVCLYKKDFKIRKHVHTLVGKSFLPNPKLKPQINHKNGIKTDNRVENLEWSTQKENIIHAFKNNLQIPIRGEDVVTSKLKTTDIVRIRKMRENGKFWKTIADKYNVSISCIRLIVNRTNWGHVQ